MGEMAGNEDDAMVRQRYGSLATGLNEALAGARDALEAHAGLLPEGRMGELDDLLAEFARRRIRIALYGEVKSGKSTLINALAGAELSPVAFDPLTSIPVRITYGSRTVWRVGERGVDSLNELAEIMREGAEAAEVVVETDLDLLQLGGQLDVLDTPGVGSEERFDSISAEVLRSLDAVVLVVRYPALFTKLTRTLMQGLEVDIGMLFVVWNLDTACAELTPEERARHADTLRARVAGSHELYLVDARAGARAAGRDDRAGIEASGLGSFREALGRFASSEKRGVVALREAAKRADHWLEEAQRALTERTKHLDSVLSEARGRLRAVHDAADAKSKAACAQFDEFRSSVAMISAERARDADARAEGLRKQLRALRRSWMRSGDFDALAEAVATAAAAYADLVSAAVQATMQSMREAAARFGTQIPETPWDRQVPSVDALTSDDRKQRAAEGRGRLVRRVLWRRWYLPGVTALEREVVSRDLASQSAWFDTATRGAEAAARSVLDTRLAEIERQAETETARIKTEVDFEAAEAEFEALGQHLPIVTEKRERVARINADARTLL